MSFTVDMIDSETGDFIETMEEFETEEEAQAYLDETLDSFGAGAETLMLAGEDYIDPDAVDFEINEH